MRSGTRSEEITGVPPKHGFGGHCIGVAVACGDLQSMTRNIVSRHSLSVYFL